MITVGEYTLDDLASGSSGGSSGGSSTGEWVNNLVNNLDDKGLLRPLVLGEQRSMDEIQGTDDAQSNTTTEASEAGSPDLDAERLQDLMLTLYDNTSMIPGVDDDPQLSDLIKLVDSNPEMVDKMIQQYL